MFKWFHAGPGSPQILQFVLALLLLASFDFHSSFRSILGVTPLQVLNIAPSGAVTPANATEWWDAGACVVGSSSCSQLAKHC